MVLSNAAHKIFSTNGKFKHHDSLVRPDEYAGWYQALTLTERVNVLRLADSSNGQIDKEIVERRLKRWRSQMFSTNSLYQERLAMDGIEEEVLGRLLGEPNEAIRGRSHSQPDWLTRLVQAYSHLDSLDIGMTLLESWRERPEAGFFYVIAPLIRDGMDRLREGIQALSARHMTQPFDTEKFETVIMANWPWELSQLLSRTLVLELHVARLQGLLSGNTPEERFESFIHRLCQRNVVRTFLEEYPVLVRQLLIHIDNRIAFSLEFLERLCSDWQILQNTLGADGMPSELVRLDGNVGDKHRGGRSVLIATFRSGWKVVYKPKPLGADAHFQELLAWMNRHSIYPDFRTHKVLDRGTYGWAEYVEAEPCQTSDQIERFYRRQGGYLALLYALSSTDFHFENMVAAGEYPVLLDLETLFHPSRERADVNNIGEILLDRLLKSVLKVGLLPMRLWFSEQSEGLDISGLGASQGQLSPDYIPYWEATGTDTMRLQRRRLPLKEGQHRPKLDGREVSSLDYVESVVTGFTATYRFLMRHRDELIATQGPLNRFREDVVRVIIRPTRFYAKLLHDSFHPDVLRNALDRDRLFDQLWRAVENDPALVQVIPLEREDLYQGDIPTFTTRPGSCDLWSSSGKRVIDFFDQDTRSSIERRLLQFSHDDLQRQTWFIRSSFATMAMGDKPSRLPKPISAKSSSRVDHDQLISVSRAIGDRLQTLAVQSKGNATWVGLTLLNDRNWVLAASGLDLYSGLSGIALFLAYLGHVTGEVRYTTLAEATTNTLCVHMEEAKPHVTSIGAFSGWGGLIYAFTHLGALWNQPDLITKAKQILELLPKLIEHDEQFDIIGGAAGCIASLSVLYSYAPSAKIVEAALLCGDRLLSCAQPMEQGLGWVANGFATYPLSGFSHGAAGIAWGLVELAKFSGETRFLKAAREAIEFERTLFYAQEGNWADRRRSQDILASEQQSQGSFMTAWCNGAPGIGLGRLRLLDYIDNPTIQDEIDVALRTTLRGGFGGNHSLCHGDLGNLELFLEAKHTLNSDYLHNQVDIITTQIVDNINRYGWLCGVPLAVETPGLMTGLSGIGYELLRLAEPKLVPSVLLLEPPVLRPGKNA